MRQLHTMHSPPEQQLHTCTVQEVDCREKLGRLHSFQRMCMPDCSLQNPSKKGREEMEMNSK